VAYDCASGNGCRNLPFISGFICYLLIIWYLTKFLITFFFVSHISFIYTPITIVIAIPQPLVTILSGERVDYKRSLDWAFALLITSTHDSWLHVIRGPSLMSKIYKITTAEPRSFQPSVSPLVVLC
jgi:hypothetical protein